MKMLILFYNTLYVMLTGVNHLNNNLLYFLGTDLLFCNLPYFDMKSIIRNVWHMKHIINYIHNTNVSNII
jgi:hypothetical protein